MRFPTRRRPSIFAALWSCCLVWSLAVSAESVNIGGFAVDTEVTSGDGQSVMSSTTVFDGPRAYDVLHGGAADAARFDFKLQRVDFVDRTHRMRSYVTFAEIVKFQSELVATAQRHKGFGSFLAHPTFIEEYDASESKIRLSSVWFTYEADVVQTPTEVNEQLTRFADWSARVGGLFAPEAPPASTRLELNRALQKANWRAARVVRKAGPNAPQLPTMRSAHQLRETLSPRDRSLVDGVENDLREFRQVSLSEFRRISQNSRNATKE